MSAKLIIPKIRILKGTGPSVLARVVENDATDVVEADLNTITWSLFDLDSAARPAIIDAASLTVSDVVFDTLQTDGRWTEDTTGYNFLHEIAAANFATGGHTYRAEYLFTPNAGEPWMIAALIEVTDTLT